MKVTVISKTESPIETCAIAALTCKGETIPTELSATYAQGVVKRVMAEGHHSIAEHATITIGVEGLSRASSHQLVRARIASYAQQSQRHVVIKGEYFVIPQSIIDAGEADYFSECMAQDLEDYAYLINAGVPVEDARYVLSSATTTNIVITMNMRSWRHFFEERMCLKAQTEIREMATKIFWVCNEIVPELLFGNFPKCGSKGECAKCGGPS